MILAELNLEAESWLLVRLGISLVQPLLILLLILGMVAAITHLLTMIGTKWGDYRTTGKSLLLSVGFHFLLACGLISLIPEYHAPVQLSVVEEIAIPIRMASSGTILEGTPQEGFGGTGPVGEGLPAAQALQQDRVRESITRAGENLAPQRLPDLTPLAPAASPDLASRVEAQQPNPQQAAMPQAELPRANLVLPASPLLAAPMLQNIGPSFTPERRVGNGMIPDDPIPPLRVPTGGAQLDPATGPSIDRPASNIGSLPLPFPSAPLVQPGQPLEERRDRLVLPPAQAQMLGPNTIPSPGANGPPVENRITRVEPRGNELPGITPLQPRERVVPSIPDVRPLLRETPNVASDLVIPVPAPAIVRQGEDPFLRRDDRDSLPSVYRLRNDQERERALKNYGGTVETEEAVDRALKWLAANQTRTGYWDASAHGAGQAQVSQDGINREGAGATADAGVTALAVLAFLGKLNTVDQGDYSENVTRALKWLISQQKSRDWGQNWGSTDGYLGGDATDFEAMYCHGMATFALAEAYVMSRDNVEAQWLRPPLEKAVKFILETQIADGGWRYIKGQPEGDMSMFGWQLMALKSAEAAGIPIDPRHRTLMEAFLTSRRRGTNGGLAGYLPREGPTAAMTAEAMYCRQILGIVMEESAATEAVTYLLARPPERTNLNLYYWYYGTLAMFQHGGPEWDRWNLLVRDLLVSEQRKTGDLAGSWDPRDVWGPYGGRVYSTAIATLSLEVYYRYLPLYRLKEKGAGTEAANPR